MAAKTVSELTGFGRQETQVSKLIAVALKSEEGADLYDALAKSIWPHYRDRRNTSRDIRINARSEYLYRGNRLDVVIGVWNSAQVEIHILEVKVTAEQGQNQLERYAEICSDEGFLSKARAGFFPESSPHVQCSADVTYLTVVPEESMPANVHHTTFAEWHDSLGDVSEPVQSGPLSAQLLRDVLQHLGPDSDPERVTLGGLDAGTPLAHLRHFLESDPLLVRKYTRRAAELLGQELSSLSSESAALKINEMWLHESSGFELGFKSGRWILGSERPELEGFALDLAISVNADRLQRRTLNLGFKVSPRPYKKRKALQEEFAGENFAYFKRFRDEFSDELTRKLSSGSYVIQFSRTNYYMRILKSPISIGDDESIGSLAKKVWERSIIIGKLADEVIAERYPHLLIADHSR